MSGIKYMCIRSYKILSLLYIKIKYLSKINNIISDVKRREHNDE